LGDRLRGGGAARFRAGAPAHHSILVEIT
jgi:hypothetical protein